MNDTIVAVSTARGLGAIAVVRLSGPEAVRVTLRHLSVSALEPRRATFALYSHLDQPLDETVVTWFKAPHSYTGEDLVEISCHGSLYIQQTLLESLLAEPEVRLAEPGEFTRRAFVNGRMDLSQAEAVADLIESHSVESHRLALNQLRGGVSSALGTMRDQLVELTSLLELELDFSEEEVEFADRSQLTSLVSRLEAEVGRLVASFQLGNALKNGVPVAIVGQPNAGKSTLLNALLDDDRAIVSPIAGTTRDTIEETLNLQGVTFRFIDTAGIRESDDLIERSGIERSLKAISMSSIVLYLAPCTLSHEEVEQELKTLAEQVEGKKLLVVRTKSDLMGDGEKPALSDQLYLSAPTGEGLDALREWLLRCVDHADQADATLLTNVRHRDALQRVGESLLQVRSGIDAQLPADLVVVDIRDALYHLGTVTGQVTSNEVLGTIFSRFCIGK